MKKFINKKTATVIKFVASTAAALFVSYAITMQCCTCIEFIGTIAEAACNKIENM